MQKIEKLLQSTTRDESIFRYCYILYQLCFVQQRINYDKFATLLNMYLHECDLQRRRQKILTTLNVCSNYKRTKKAFEAVMKNSVDKIRKFDFIFTVVIIIDNFNMKKNRNNIKIDDKSFFILAAIGLTNIKINIFEIDFLKSRLFKKTRRLDE